MRSGELQKYHTMSESLEIITFPRVRGEHLKPPGSAILVSTSLFPKRRLNQRLRSGDKSLFSTPQSNLLAAATAARFNLWRRVGEVIALIR